MNNRYICRGKRKDNGEWIEGYLIQRNKTYIATVESINYMVVSTSYMASIELVEVITETVGQCTGLKDKNGKLIFKDDVLKGFSYPFLSDEEHNYYAIVVWFEDSAAFGIYTIKNPESKVRGISSGNTEYMSEWDSNNWEIIGNIHDNPELTEVQE